MKSCHGKSHHNIFLIGKMSRPADHAIIVHRSLLLAKNREENFLYRWIQDSSWSLNSRFLFINILKDQFCLYFACLHSRFFAEEQYLWCISHHFNMIIFAIALNLYYIFKSHAETPYCFLHMGKCIFLG